jgi:TRAP-type mannitol/chloroaromatic compound transport system substrate-binding protein
MSKLRFTLVLVGLSVLTGTATTTSAQERVRWKMQSAFASSLPHLGPSAVRFSKDIERMSGGKFEVKFYEPGALIPPLECFDAVSKGSIESCWTTPGYHTGKYPSLAFFTTVPFGPNFGEFLAWKWFGGGNKLREEIYAKHDLYAVDCFCIGPETSGWFRNEIKSVDDLKGLKMRFFGLGAQVMQKLGVSTQLLAAADIYQALERGVIDATEFSMPMMDIKLGFHQIAKYNYFPGWHQQVSCSEFLMNKKAWDALPDHYEAMVEVAGNAQGHLCRDRGHAIQWHGGDARQAPRPGEALGRQNARGLREGVARGHPGRVGEGRPLQEGGRSLFGLPQAVRDLGRFAVDEGNLRRQLSAGPGARRQRPPQRTGLHEAFGVHALLEPLRRLQPASRHPAAPTGSAGAKV